MSEDEIPPVWMWHLDEETGPWLEESFRIRKEKMGITDDGGSSRDRGSSDMMSNELADGRR